MTSIAFEEVTLSGSHGGCKAFGILTAEVKMNGCTYTVAGTGQVPNTAISQIVCPVENEITTVMLTCVMHIEPQVITGHIVYDNEAGTPSDVKATYTFEGIKYTETTGCPNVENSATTSNGTITGSSTLKATNTAGLSVSL